MQLQRQVLNAGRVNALNGDADSDVHLAAAERYAAARAAIAGLTPIDPATSTSVLADLADGNESADAARLRQVVEADRANDHGGNADSYVAVLTVLAVALFLLGLSLTVQGRTRYVLAAPGVAIALVCVAWTGLIATRDVTNVSERAVRAAAEGQRLQDAGDFEAAIAAYDEAIAESPDFAAAFARRADARFAQGSSQIGQTGFISITSPEALEASLEDTERALDLGAGDDIVTLADAAFLFFLDRDFDRSADLVGAGAGAERLARPGVVQPRRGRGGPGRRAAAARAYREGRQALVDAPDVGTRSQVLAGARTDLSVLRDAPRRRRARRRDRPRRDRRGRAGRLRGLLHRAAVRRRALPERRGRRRRRRDRRADVVELRGLRLRDLRRRGRRAGHADHDGLVRPQRRGRAVRADGPAARGGAGRRRRQRLLGHAPEQRPAVPGARRVPRAGLRRRAVPRRGDQHPRGRPDRRSVRLRRRRHRGLLGLRARGLRGAAGRRQRHRLVHELHRRRSSTSRSTSPRAPLSGGLDAERLRPGRARRLPRRRRERAGRRSLFAGRTVGRHPGHDPRLRRRLRRRRDDGGVRRRARRVIEEPDPLRARPTSSSSRRSST